MQWNCTLFVSGSEKCEKLAHQSRMSFQHGSIEYGGLATHCGNQRGTNKCMKGFFPHPLFVCLLSVLSLRASKYLSADE